MDREEILAKSRKENDLSDERTKYIGLKGANFAITILVLLWVALSRLAPLEDTALRDGTAGDYHLLCQLCLSVPVQPDQDRHFLYSPVFPGGGLLSGTLFEICPPRFLRKGNQLKEGS